ncbi:ribosomal RNA-processing protein 8 isoform X4 [Amborella trichopoda]|uniref:ribosomal RNA-processing protein 8 isoform X4 n=1 Tax=Amborella trichopoda TaxID=13333 RepID=UPI0005D35025|nr:ribosomal RNA-processing protein 8 isoform X4 [Amborella trichopoda]|eukprot:XP_011626191.1 ribosomal RNA-processing protein 8 isoform X4 [Amborella trichopoda]
MEALSNSKQKKDKRKRRSCRGERNPSHPQRQQKRRKCLLDQSTQEPKSNNAHTPPAPKSSTFLDKMRARLSGGHFRMINEKLYSCSGSDALSFFKKDPALFNTYHAGYQAQMSHWPEQPVDVIIKWLKGRKHSLIVADFGCGDALLARSVKNKVFSIDLVACDPSVIACDMSNEAHRVLRPGGWLLIAEVRSRFDPNNGGADPDMFSKAVQKLGFITSSKDFSNKMFVLFFFQKKEKPRAVTTDIKWPKLKPCMYKRR